MQYDIYYEKVNKIAGFMKKVFKFMWLILLVLAIITAAVVTFLALRGNVTEDGKVDATYVYGDSIEFTAKALFSKVKVQYFVDGNWVETPPTRPGTYKVRGVSRGGFVKEKYTEEHSFEILKRDVTVNVSGKKITYGNTPELIADNLLSGHTFTCANIKTELIKTDEGKPLQIKYTPSVADIKIFDANGGDVTDCYNVTVGGKKIEVTPRALRVTVSDQSMVYNNMLFTYDGYETDGGEAMGDQVVALFTSGITDVGEIENTPVISVVNSKGEDVSRYYNIIVNSGKLTVEKRPLVITTESASKVYDGQPLFNKNYKITGEYDVANGHVLNLSFPSIVNPTYVKNIPVYSITDEQDVDRT